MLGDLPVQHDDRVLIDYRTSDDAGVYRLDARRALVQTVDFFTPIVDDPFVYGQIAAANALSDVYAMGGRPLTALAIAAFPERRRARDPQADFRRRAGQAARGRTSCCSAGIPCRTRRSSSAMRSRGRSIPARVLANGGAQPGDVLILTKADRNRRDCDRAEVRPRAASGHRRGGAIDDDAEPGGARPCSRPCRRMRCMRARTSPGSA